MPLSERKGRRTRVVKAVHGTGTLKKDPAFEKGLAGELKTRYGREDLVNLFRSYSTGDAYVDRMMRRACLRALVIRLGDGASIGTHVGIRHPETFEIGHSLYLGEQTVIHGRFDGRCTMGNRVWIGPQCCLDARDLVIGNSVGLGPGVKILGSRHTGLPLNVPIIETDLEIASVRIGNGADIGVGAVVMPGVTIGSNSIVGAGAVVTKDVPSFSKVAGVPASVMGWRKRKGQSG
jgi:acetyltransferase-like isoleucine patch superfamily enzyme